MREAPAKRTPSAARGAWGRVLFATTAVAVFVADRVTKALVEASIPVGVEHPLIDHRVWLTHVQNSGAAFGVAPLGSVFFLAVSLAVALALIVVEARRGTLSGIDPLLGLVLGGSLGNAYDRLFNGGSVTDFVALHFWPVFNVADASITVGVAALVLGYGLRKGQSS
ncbi:MAG: signal peptidase II [Candidatus Dormibacteraceae bacterium]